MRNFLFTLAFLFSILLNAQNSNENTVAITGTVIDSSTKEPIEQAGIRILNAKDSSYIKGAATNASGKFTIQVTPGSYIANISFIGYTDSHVNINANKSQNSLGEILLREDGILLSEATIVAKAPEIVVKGDTIEYNADSYKVQESAMVEDLLKKMPGAEVDANGKITINGKEVKKILVDGKEFFSDDPKVASKNLPASMVDKLQVLDRKTDMSLMTGFDDGDEETVINLTVKKGMKQGVFGNAYAGGGNHGRYEGNATVNYMQDNNQFTVLGGANNTNNAGFSDFSTSSFGGMSRPRGLNFGGNNGITKAANGGFNFAMDMSPKFKWGGDIRYGNTDNDLKTTSRTEYLKTEDRAAQFETKTEWGNNISDNFNANLRFEWTPDSATKIIFKPNIRYNKNRKSEQGDFLSTYEDPNDSVYWGKSDYNSHGDGYNLNGELEVSRKLGKTGRVLSFSVSGGLSNQENDGSNYSDKFYSDPLARPLITDQIFNQKNDGRNWRAFVSYVEPIGRSNFLQLTYSYRNNHSESDKITHRYDNILSDYSVLDTASTRKLENDFINQEIALNFKSVRQKYNYTVGFAAQPSKSESWNISPNPDLSTFTENNVVNFSPVAQFNYLWDKRTNLRVDYKGTVNQPTTTQLSTAKDESNPTNIIIGNPNLDPSFSNRLRVRYRKFNAEQASAFMLFGNFNFTTNDIVNYTTRDSLNNRTTTYKNVDGNWNANLRMIINRPLRNKKFSINSMTYGSYSHSNGFLDDLKTTNNSLSLQESLGLEYRSDVFDFGVRGNFRYNDVRYTLNEEGNRTTYDYGGNVNSTLYLPYNFTIETDLNYSTNSGYSNGFKLNEWLWNASISKQIFKAKNGTIRFKIYDILQDKKNISRSSTNEYIQDVSTSTLSSYFMFHFVYKFQIFKGGAKQEDMQSSGRRSQGGGGGHHRM